MPLAADEVLLYPRRRRYIIVICIGFADTKIYSRRGEHCSPFHYGFIGGSQSGNRNKCIRRSSKAPLKSLPLRSLRGRCHLGDG